MEEEAKCLQNTTPETLDSSSLVAPKVSDAKSKVEYGKLIWHNYVIRC